MALVTNLSFFYLILLSPAILSGASHHGAPHSNQDNSSLGERIISMIVDLGRSSTNSWDKLKSSIFQVHEKLFPPTLDFRSDDQTPLGEESGVKARVKKAAKKSSETSEAALEKTAEIAATKLVEAVDKTKKKVKAKASKTQQLKTEL